MTQVISRVSNAHPSHYVDTSGDSDRHDRINQSDLARERSQSLMICASSSVHLRLGLHVLECHHEG